MRTREEIEEARAILASALRVDGHAEEDRGAMAGAFTGLSWALGDPKGEPLDRPLRQMRRLFRLSRAAKVES
jgi:hypothetical protein